MQLYKTVDSNNLIRIEDEDGSAITVATRYNYAVILSLYVQESQRREGIGTALINAVSQILLSRGIGILEADYPDSLEGFGNFLGENGFFEKSTAPVLSVDLKELLSKASVKRTILSDEEGMDFVSLADLTSGQLEELFDSFAGMDLMIDDRDMTRFFYDASGVVYDDSGRPGAFVLCSLDEDESSVHVDYLAGMEKGNPKYIMGAVRGMLTCLLEAGGDRVYKNITMLAANPAVNEMLDRVLEDGEAPETIGKAVYALKRLDAPCGGTETVYSPDEDMDDEWRREIRSIPLQANIGIKMPWIRHSDDDGKEKAEYEEDIRETEETATVPDDTYEVMFRKDVDETEGLEYMDTVRITPGNLERFRDYLDGVSASDVSRCYFRGLAALTEDTPCALMVYELKDYDEDDDTEAEITYLSIRDKEAGRRLLAEFFTEARKTSVKRMYFELEELSDLEEELLLDSGFSIEKKEGSDLFLTLEMLHSIYSLSKKPKKYIRSIRSLSEKQMRLGITNCLFHNRKGILEDLGILPDEWFERDVSSCVVSDGKVTGLFLIHLRGDDSLSMDLLYSAGAEYQLDLLNMLRYSLAAAIEKYPEGTRAFVRRHNSETRRLTGKLFPDISGAMVYAGEKRNRN